MSSGISANGNSNEVTWHTFAGGRINSTLRYVLNTLEPNCVITPDNLSVRVRDPVLTESRFRDVVRELNDTGFWECDTIWQKGRTALPAYRLIKFQPLMPRAVEQEVLFNFLLDRGGTADWLRGQSSRM